MTGGEDLRFSLFKNEKAIHNHTCSNPKNTSYCKSNTSMVDIDRFRFRFRTAQLNESSAFILTGVTAENYGIYRCEGISTYPPPYTQKPSPKRILVLADGKNS